MKINVAELLKGCPKGMELDCTLYDNVTLISVDNREGMIFPIKVSRKDGIHITLTKYGQLANADYAKCVIFPKSKTTWEGFVPPCEFKDGDILTNERGSICIYKGPMYYNQNLADFYCGYRISDNAFVLKKFKDEHFGDINKLRRVSEIEKQHFFQILLNNGYKWNPETKILEKLIKPKFKVGDCIRLLVYNNVTYTVIDMTGTHYTVKSDGKYVCEYSIPISTQDKYELAPKKFDVNTLKPFDKVLVRTERFTPIWTIAFYDGYQPEIGGGFRPFGVVNGEYFQQCIPYEGNEHLRGTTNDCDDFYKTW